MARKEFTEEEIAILKTSPHVMDVSPAIIHFNAAFKELFKDEILEAEQNGELRGQRQGQEKMGALMAKLLQAGRTEDALRASTDEDFRERLFAEYQMV